MGKRIYEKSKYSNCKFWKVTSFEEAKEVINKHDYPLVVKVDGLASGKGVFIPQTKDECLIVIKSIFNGKFGDAGQVIVLEEKINGPEVSVFALCDGKKFILLPTAQDHKRLNEKTKVLIQVVWEPIPLPH